MTQQEIDQVREFARLLSELAVKFDELPLVAKNRVAKYKSTFTGVGFESLAIGLRQMSSKNSEFAMNYTPNYDGEVTK